MEPSMPLDRDTMIGLVSSVLSELNIGLFIYHLEDHDDPKSLKLLYANQMASEYTRTDLSDRIGLYILDAFPGLEGSGLHETYADVVRHQRSRNVGAFEYQGDDVEPGYYSVKVFPMPHDCAGIAFENITARKRLEEMVKKLRTNAPG